MLCRRRDKANDVRTSAMQWLHLGTCTWAVVALLGAAHTSSASDKEAPMRIQMTLDGRVIATATLDHNESARSLLAMLPLRLTLKDYAATEKIADLPQPLATRGAPPGYKPAAGDISYYVPWGNLAIFHKDFRHSDGLIRLGRIESGIEAMRRSDPLNVLLQEAPQ